MNIKKFSGIFYTRISKYWAYDYINDNNEYTQYNATNIIYNIEEVIECIKLKQMSLNKSHLDYMEYYYNINIVNFDKKKAPTLDKDDIIIMKNDKIDKSVKSAIDSKIKKRSELTSKKIEMEEKIYELENSVRKDFYRKLGDKKNIDKNLDGFEVEDYLYRNKILSKKDEENIENDIKSCVSKNNPKIIKTLYNSKLLIQKISEEIKKLRKNLYVQIPKTLELVIKRKNIEKKYLSTLYNFLSKYKLINDFLSEITKEETDYEYDRISSFYIPPIVEATNILSDEIPTTISNIKASGYIPFTSNKISGKNSEIIKKIEIDWWIDFFKNKNTVEKQLEKTGLEFLRNIDVYYKV